MEGTKRTKLDDAMEELANESGLNVAEITKFVKDSMDKKAKEVRKQEMKDREVARKIELGIARVGDIFEHCHETGGFYQIISFKGKMKGALSSETSTTVVVRKIRHELGEVGPWKGIKDRFIGEEQTRRIEIGEGTAYIPALFAEKIIQ